MITTPETLRQTKHQRNIFLSVITWLVLIFICTFSKHLLGRKVQDMIQLIMITAEPCLYFFFFLPLHHKVLLHELSAIHLSVQKYRFNIWLTASSINWLVWFHLSYSFAKVESWQRLQFRDCRIIMMCLFTYL